MAPSSKLLFLASLLPAVLAGPTKNQDSCVNALTSNRHIEAAQAFCNVFTETTVTSTKSIPSFVLEDCSGRGAPAIVSRVSSACSVFKTASPTPSACPLTVVLQDCKGSATTVIEGTTVSTVTVAPSASTVTLPPSTVTQSVTVTEAAIASTQTQTVTESVTVSVPVFASSTLVTRATSSSTSIAKSKTCLNPQVSCLNTTAVADTCCFNAPGGQLLLTQFWDTSPSTGPSNAWTLHGLWPDRCDGTYDAFCDTSRQYTNITGILQSYGKTALLADMNTYWKDYAGNDESFWEHEWSKHGTCISTFDTKCYTDYTAQAEVADYFEKAVALYKGLDSYTILANAGIVPSSTASYSLANIQAALAAFHGFIPTLQCASGAIDEIWYHYNVRGSVQTGDFIPAAPDGSKSNCPATVKYLPKYQSGTTATATATGTATATATSAGASATSTGAPYAGKGFLQAYTSSYASGTNTGCLISAGTWYVGGTCAGFTAAASGAGFTLTSSKGPCTVTSTNTISCASGNSASVFNTVNGLLAYGQQSTFYAAAVPSGSTQQPVHLDSQAVRVEFKWQSA